jgi:exopolysaccharide biosynthesis polyprenyl glycosylphosphotransferase
LSLEGITPHLGDYKKLRSIVAEYNVEEVLIAIEARDNKLVTRIVNDLIGLDLVVKAIPNLYDYLTGRVKMTAILGTPLIQISFDLMPTWQQKVKLLIDFSLSLFALVLLSPVFIIIAIIIKLTSKGPIFYSQERIGRYGKPFMIYKFRSMYADAEANGPALSSKDDRRITPIGRFLRKTRLDEVPNFYNVIKGDMSLVGPRPERMFYIDQIVKKAPHYLHLQKVKPGITSWGQVKYGYAENVDQMIHRLKFDLLYIENMTLFVDLKILIYTLITVFRGRGV